MIKLINLQLFNTFMKLRTNKIEKSKAKDHLKNQIGHAKIWRNKFR